MDYSKLGNKNRARSPHATRMRNKIGLLIMRVTISLVLIGGFAAVGAGMGLYIGILNNSPTLDIGVLGPLVGSYSSETSVVPDNIKLTSVIVDFRTGEEIERLHGGHNRTFAPIGEMPEHLLLAFVAIEDERFYEHNGIDPRGIARAIWVTTQPNRATEGASTITQQLVKNMLGYFDSTSFVMKLQEQHIAINFEKHLADEFAKLGYEDSRRAAKDYILETYINMINLGQQNYGVQAAAQFYYDISVSDLTIAQAATIASIAQNPSRFPPDVRPESNWRRTQLVLENMKRLGFITEEEFEEAMQSKPVLDEITGEPLFDDEGKPRTIGLVYDTIFRMQDGGTRPLTSDYSCFVDALLRNIRNDLMSQYNMTGVEADRRIFETGLTINTTQDMNIQAIVDAAFLNEELWPGIGMGFSIEVTYYLTVYNNITQQGRHYSRKHDVANMEEAEAFILRVQEEVLKNGDEVAGENIFYVPQPQGAFVLIDNHTGHVLAIRGIRGEKQGNRAFNRATEALRSPGSQMKPLAPFAAMFELGMLQPGSVIDDIPFTLPAPGGRQGWTPGNHWGSGYRGLTTARAAIYTSANVVSARAAADTRIDCAGMPTMVSYLELMGIRTISENDGPAIVLGGMTNGVHLIELAGAYATIANGGEYNKPVLYTTVLDHEGNILLENPHNPQRVLRASTAFLLTDCMTDTITRGTGGRAQWTSGSGLRGRIPIAGKTGTSQRNRDLGFSGFTPYYTASIWLGNDNETALHRRSNEFHTPLWRHIMEEIHIDLPSRSFERPAGVVNATICIDSGHTPTALCSADSRGDRTRSEIFTVGYTPSQTCNVHRRYRYCTESGMIAGTSCPDWAVVERIGIVRAQPIDGVSASVSDRNQEFPLAVRQGHVCFHGGFVNPNTPDNSGDSGISNWENPFGNMYWDIDNGIWVTAPSTTPAPIADTPIINFPADNAVLPTPTPLPAWPGLGNVTETPENTPTPVNTPTPWANPMHIPGLD